MYTSLMLGMLLHIILCMSLCYLNLRSYYNICLSLRSSKIYFNNFNILASKSLETLTTDKEEEDDRPMNAFPFPSRQLVLKSLRPLAIHEGQIAFAFPTRGFILEQLKTLPPLATNEKKGRAYTGLVIMSLRPWIVS